MQNEITKPNDIFVSTLVNGNVELPDLISNGITAANTQLLNPETYKESKYVQKAFSDEKGVFHEDKFLQAYELAAQQYQELIDNQTYKNIEKYVEYNKNDIFAPLESKKADVSYEIIPERNPQRRSHGVSSLFEYGTATKSMRELAQQSKIWDSENQVWLDKTADERGILGSIFGQSLVYATWDEDGVHTDALTGRQIQHKKGDWKLNDKGQYYTETIGNRSSRGKQFVAVSDTLTKEGSALNKIDVFDSDDLEKSVTGTTVKALLKIAPYLFPQTQVVWGGITAAIEMSKIMPKFLKVGEGLIMGGDADDETGFTHSMNRWENYMSKFEKSKSDRGQRSGWTYESIADIASDTFAQLYQMRAAASLSKLAVKDPTHQAIKKFQKEILPKQMAAAQMSGKSLPKFTDKEISDLIVTAAQKMPEVKKAIEMQSALSRALSSGYMALSSTADVFDDALEGGYDRRTAGLAALSAAVGQYLVMTNTSLGEWMLDKNVGYSEHANRATILKALRPYYDDIAKSMDKLGQAATKVEKESIIQKVIGKTSKGINKAWDTIKEDGSIYWRNALTESIEEMSEEAVMDATKGVFDMLTSFGFGRNRDASFGIAQDFTSGSFLERYAQSAFGGFLGGALFELQQKKIDPWARKVFMGQTMEDIQPSLIHEIANGRTADVYRAIDELIELDNESSAVTTEINGKEYFGSANGGMTRGQAVGKVLKSYVSVLEGALIDENANLTDDQLLQKTMRDFEAIKLIKEGGLDKLLVTDFTKLTSEIASIKLAIAQKEKDQAKKGEEKKDAKKDEKDTTPSDKEKQEALEFDDGKYENKSLPFLQALLEKKREQLSDFLSGKKSEEYLYKTLTGATTKVREAVGEISVYDFAFLKYGKELKDLPKSGNITQKSVKQEYEDWKKETNSTKRFLNLGVDAYGDFDQRFSKYVSEYVESNYNDIRQVTYDKLLSGNRFLRDIKEKGIKSGNFGVNELIDDDASYQIIKSVANALKSEAQIGDAGSSFDSVTLQDIFKQDVLKLKNVVSQILDQNPQYTKLLMDSGKTREQLVDGFSAQLQHTLENTNINSLKGLGLGAYLVPFFQSSIDKVFDSMIDSLPTPTLGAMQAEMLKRGYIDTVFANADLDISDREVLKNRFYESIGFTVEGIDVGLSTSLLHEYLMSQETIDGTVALRVEEYAMEAVLNKALEMSRDKTVSRLCSYDDLISNLKEVVDITPSQYKPVIDAINNEFGTRPLKDIITDAVKPIAEQKVASVKGDEGLVTIDDIANVSSIHGLTAEHLVDPEKLTEFLTKFFLDNFESLPAYQMYKEISKKQVKQNPIFDSLSKIDMLLSESGASKVLEILKKQHYKIRKAERFEDYMPKGEEKIQLTNALQAINMYEALVTGMSQTALGLGNPFGINQQMQRFLEKNKIKSSREYKTIDFDAAELILSDLAIIKQQITGYLQFGERAYSNKVEEDGRIKKQYSTKLKEYIDAKASAFTIDDFSLLPTEEEKAKYKEPEEVIALYAHSIYTKFHARFKTPEEKAAAVKKLIEKLGLKGQFNRSSKPTNLTKDVTVINEYDQLLWLATALGADQFEFYHRYNQLFIGDTKTKLVPLYSQEMAALQAWSFSRSKSDIRSKNGTLISVHEALMEEVLEEGKAYIPAGNMILINGITGAGKSSAVSAIVHQLNSDKITYVTAANAVQQQKYVKQISKGHPEKDLVQTGSISDLLGKFFTKDGRAVLLNQIKFTRTAGSSKEYVAKFTDPLFVRRELTAKTDILEINKEKIDKLIDPKIDLRTIPEQVYIDEATQVDAMTLQVLKYLGSKFGFKVLLSGDSTQRGLPQFNDPQAWRDLFMWTTSKLNLSVRAANNQKSANNIAFNRHLEVYEALTAENHVDGKREFTKYLSDVNNQQVISYYQNDEIFAGDKFIESFDDAKSDLKLIASLNAKEKKKAIIITKLDADNKPVNTALPQILQEAGFALDQYEFYSFEDAHDRAVQGSESNYVIVDGSYLQDNASGTGGELLRAVYTFASRSLKGTLMVLPVKTQKTIGIINRQDKFTQIDEIPQLAEVAKIKEARQKTIETMLNGYTPGDLELAKLTTAEIDGKKVAVRKNQAAPKTETPKKKTIVSDNEAVDESKLPEEQQRAIEKALNSEINLDPVNPIMKPDATDEEIKENAELINITARRTKYVEKSSTPNLVRWYSALDHLGVPLKKGHTNIWDARINRGTCLDMDGLFDPQRGIMSQTRTGFIKFRQTIAAASSKEDIVDVIRHDQEIAAFLYEAAPQVYQQQNPTGSATTDWNNEKLKDIYADWFRDHVTIDDNYHVFAKKLDWEVDKTTNTINADVNKSVGQGNTVLYFGIKLKSDDVPPILHQYISLGTMSKRTYTDINGVEREIKSKELQALYDRAHEDLAEAEKNNTVGQVPFVAYKLDSKVFTATLNSTLWIRKASKPGEEGRFETVAEMRRRGFTIDTDNVFLVDSTKVEYNGRQEYKAIIMLALLGYTAEDINPDVRRAGAEPMTMEQKIEALNNTFVDKETGDLRISGSYMAIAQSTLMGLGNTEKLPAYQRIIFLNPKKFNIQDVFKDLAYIAGNKEFNKANWRQKLSKCRPSSQTKVITDMLAQADVFYPAKNGKDPSSHLLKYLVGWRDTMQNMLGGKDYYQNDLNTLNKLIDWASKKIQQNEPITRDDFYKELMVTGHRALLMPFYRAFITTNKSGSYQMLNLKNVEPLSDNDGVLRYSVSGKNPGHILLNLDEISQSYACPAFGKIGDEGDTTNIVKYFIDQELVLPKDLPEDIAQNTDGAYMAHKVNFTSDTAYELGMYGYELQSPVYSISNEDLASAQKVEYSQLETKADRWPDRKTFGELITEAPEGFDPSLYRPTILPASAFDDSNAKQYGELYVKRETKTVTKKNGQKKTREVEYYYDLKTKSPKPMPSDKKAQAAIRAYLKERKWKTWKKQVEVTVPGKFEGYVTKKGLHHQVINKMGFEVRIGDIVQLWGDETTAVRVVDVNTKGKDGIMLRVDAIFDGSGNPGTINKLFKPVEVPLEGVTKMVKRQVAAKEHIKFDYYTKGEWKIDNPLEKGKYKETVKEGTTMGEIIDDMQAGGYHSGFDFENYYYYAVPISNMPGVDEGRQAYLSLPYGIDGHQREGQELLGSVSDLVDFHSRMQLLHGADSAVAVQGYTLFRYKREDYDATEKGKWAEFVVNSIRETGANSAFIAHQVFFDSEYVQVVQDAIDRATPATYYSREKTSLRFSAPSDLPIALGKKWSMAEIRAYQPKSVILTKADWANRGNGKDFNEHDFIRYQDPETGNYVLYPRHEFYYRADGSGKKYTSREFGAIIYEDWDKFVISGTSVFQGAEVAQQWAKRLKGLTFYDRQFYAYDDKYTNKLQEAFHGSLSATEIKAKKREQEFHKYLLHPVINDGNKVDFDTAITIQITDVWYDMKNKKYMVTYERPGRGEQKQIDLTSFLIQFKTRFVLQDTESNAAIIEALPEPAAPLVIPSFESEETPSKPVTPVVVPDSEPESSEETIVEDEPKESEEVVLTKEVLGNKDSDVWKSLFGNENWKEVGTTEQTQQVIVQIIGQSTDVNFTKQSFDGFLELCNKVLEERPLEDLNSLFNNIQNHKTDSAFSQAASLFADPTSYNTEETKEKIENLISQLFTDDQISC